MVVKLRSNVGTAATDCNSIEPKAQDEKRIRDVKEWVSCTLNKEDIQGLVNCMPSAQSPFRS